MSAYPPPLQDLPIYNSVEFIEENFPLTIQDAKSFFLEYPTAQGAETLQNIVVNGTSAFNSDMTINGDLEIHILPPLRSLIGIVLLHIPPKLPANLPI